jgi:hypothetical protein
MSSPPRQTVGSHAWFVVAMGIAVLAGYGWGSMADDAPMDAERGVGKPTKVRERPPEGRAAGPATAREFVQALITESLDEREHWRHIRSFTEEEVKEVIADVEKLDRYLIGSWELRPMLYYRWAELDPVAANAAAIKADPNSPTTWGLGFSWSRQAVIAAWINQGGAVAAWDAVREERGMWACTRSVPGEVSQMLVAALSDRDDMTAFKEVLRLEDENCVIAELLCEARARNAARSPESRAAFLAAVDLHPRAYVRYSCARDKLLEAWSELEPEAAEAASLIWEKEREAAQEKEDAREEAEWAAREKENATGDEP